jgi:hypothetical protein
MSRRAGTEAQAIAAKGALQRINFVIRNLRFQQELKLLDPNDQPAVATLAERWGLLRIPVLSRDSHLGKLIDQERLKALAEDIPQYIPIAEHIRAYLFQILGNQESATGPQYRDVLELKVDLSYPMDIIEEAVKAEVRRAHKERTELDATRGVGQLKRIRWDKNDFQLKVYDLTKEDKTFSEIAGKLRKPVSTVKSALLVVQRKINSVRPIGEQLPPQTENGLPSKYDLPIAGFDPEDHVSRCQICSKAKTPENYCPQAQAYMNQDYASQYPLHNGRQASDDMESEDQDT